MATTITGTTIDVGTNVIVTDSAGNVGIGISSPAEMLEIYNTSSPAIQLNDGGDYKSIMRLAGNDLEIRGSSGSLEFYNGAADGDSSDLAMKIDNAGIVTKPLQPAFCVKANIQNNMALNSWQHILFANEIFDQNQDYASNTFTAPVTGKYQLQVSVRLDTIDSSTSYYQVRIATSNRAYHTICAMDRMSGDPSYWNFNIAVLADMDAGDTCQIQFIQAGGSQQTDIDGESYFSGYLVA